VIPDNISVYITEECMNCQFLEPVAEMTTAYHENKVIARDIAVSCKNEVMCPYLKERLKEE
jgi:hypothetical protein